MPDQKQPKIPPEELYRQPGAMELKKNWFALHHVLAYMLFGLLGIAAVIGIYYYQVSDSIQEYQTVVHHPKADPTADWKTYTNDQYGFEFKYPTVFISSSANNAGEALFENPETTSTLGIALYSSNKGTLIQSIASNWFKLPDNTLYDQYFVDQGYTYQNISVASHDAIRFYERGEGGEAIETFIQSGEKSVIVISWSAPVEHITLDQVLSTFKFTDNTTITPPDNGDVSCTQVITRAKNITTGQVKDFPTPCDVPTGWQIMGPSSAF